MLVLFKIERLLVILFIVAAAHAAAQDTGNTQSSGVNLGSTPFSQSVDPSYILKPNDTIKVEVFQEPDLTTLARVSADGAITIPLLGAVKVVGLTSKDATERIKQLLTKGYLVNPQVQISIIEFAKKRFTLLGQVIKPGSYEIPAQESVDLLQAIALAGGFTRIALPSAITVRRREGRSDKVYKLNANAMQKNTNYKAFYIQENDVITVPESIF